MTEQLQLLHIMVCSLKNMMHDVLINCELHDSVVKKHKVSDDSALFPDSGFWLIFTSFSYLLRINTVSI